MVETGIAALQRRVLMIAFHFPPIGGSSGFLRTACFARYFRKCAWEPIVLTATTCAYPRLDVSNNDLVQDIEVHRAFALDAKRHLSWRGKYLRILALPDQWASWTIPAVLRGLFLVKQNTPSVIWSTFPIPTALVIGYYVSKFTGIPWVVDIRDVILDDDFPESPIERRLYARLERRVARQASAIVVTTENAAAIYADRFPQMRENIHIIRNGFDEEIIGRIEKSTPRKKIPNTKTKFLHSGLLSPADRNPLPFLDALVSLRDDGILDPGRLTFDFRACGNEVHYSEEIRKRGLDDLVRLLPPVSYVDAVAEMLTADGLVLFQGRTCNHAVPAKVYEYLRCGLPIFVAADPKGETATMLSKLGCDFIADIDSKSDLAEQITRFVIATSSGQAFVRAKKDIMQFSRQQQAHALEELLNRVVS